LAVTCRALGVSIFKIHRREMETYLIAFMVSVTFYRVFHGDLEYTGDC